jgi:hypothetical protein
MKLFEVVLAVIFANMAANPVHAQMSAPVGIDAELADFDCKVDSTVAADAEQLSKAIAAAKEQTAKNGLAHRDTLEAFDGIASSAGI